MKTIRYLGVVLALLLCSFRAFAVPAADEVMKGALTKAGQENKAVFIDFGSPG